MIEGRGGIDGWDIRGGGRFLFFVFFEFWFYFEFFFLIKRNNKLVIDIG